MARNSEGRAGVLLTIVPLRGQRSPTVSTASHAAPLPLPARCTAGRLEGRLPLELTLWSSPRLQEPLLLQQFA